MAPLGYWHYGASRLSALWRLQAIGIMAPLGYRHFSLGHLFFIFCSCDGVLCCAVLCCDGVLCCANFGFTPSLTYSTGGGLLLYWRLSNILQQHTWSNGTGILFTRVRARTDFAYAMPICCILSPLPLYSMITEPSFLMIGEGFETSMLSQAPAFGCSDASSQLK